MSVSRSPHAGNTRCPRSSEIDAHNGGIASFRGHASIDGSQRKGRIAAGLSAVGDGAAILQIRGADKAAHLKISWTEMLDQDDHSVAGLSRPERGWPTEDIFDAVESSISNDAVFSMFCFVC